MKSITMTIITLSIISAATMSLAAERSKFLGATYNQPDRTYQEATGSIVPKSDPLRSKFLGASYIIAETKDNVSMNEPSLNFQEINRNGMVYTQTHDIDGQIESINKANNTFVLKGKLGGAPTYFVLRGWNKDIAKLNQGDQIHVTLACNTNLATTIAK
jgi:hypothetical protein